MKLLFAIFRYFPHGGLQRDMLRIAEEALRRGHRVTLCAMAWEGDMAVPEGMALELLPVKGWSNHARARDFARKFTEFRKGKVFDLAMGFNRIPGLDVYFAGDNCFAKSAARKWWLIRAFSPRYWTFLAFERAVFSPESGTRIFCITPRQIREFREVYGTPEERFTLLPPGIPSDRRRPENPAPVRARKRFELGVKPEETLLGEIGSGFRTKGVDRTLRAFAALPPEVKAKTRLLVVGREKSRKFEKLAAHLGISGRVIFAGARNDVPELLLAVDLLVHPARNEAAGTVLLEAIAMGTPVLCSANCGFAGFVEKSGGAVLEEPFTQKEFNRVLAAKLLLPGWLSDLRKAAVAYGANADFYRRAEVAVDTLEEVADEKDR